MPILALGSSAPPSALRTRGFTLLELLVVLAIVGLAMGGAVLALRDGGAALLGREGERLAALLEAARAQSRASGSPVRWRMQAQGFAFEGLPPQALPTQWLDPQTQARATAPLLLGPEPILAPQQVLLSHPAWPGHQLRVATDGLRPFAVEAAP